MGSIMLHLKLGVLTLLVAGGAGTANAVYQYYVEVDTPEVPLGELTFGSPLFGSNLDVILDFHDKNGVGWTRTVPGLALPGTKRQFHTTDDRLIDPCRVTLQLKEAASSASGGDTSDLGLWVPTRVEVVAYEQEGQPKIHDRKFTEIKPVTVSCPVVMNLC